MVPGRKAVRPAPGPEAADLAAGAVRRGDGEEEDAGGGEDERVAQLEQLLPAAVQVRRWGWDQPPGGVPVGLREGRLQAPVPVH